MLIPTLKTEPELARLQALIGKVLIQLSELERRLDKLDKQQPLTLDSLR